MSDRRKIGHCMRDVVRQRGSAIVDANTAIARTKQQRATRREIGWIVDSRFKIGRNEADRLVAVQIIAMAAVPIGS